MSDGPKTGTRTGLIAWFAGNHVAANLLMFFIIVAGLISVLTIQKETQPDFEANMIEVNVAYLGAAPQEVEEGVVIKIEEAIQDVEGIIELRSNAFEGRGQVIAEISVDADVNEVMNEIKIRVDAISTFPGLTEKPVVAKREFQNHVVLIAIHGDMDEFTRKAIAQEARDELLQFSAVNIVEFLGDRPYEISIEVSELTLRKYGLSMSEISQAVKNSSVDMPGGTIKSSGGDILLRTEGQVYTGHEFGQLVLRTFPDGTRLTLNDVATINDGFAENDRFGRLDGKRSANLRVYAIGKQSELETAEVVKKYVAEKSKTLPPGVEMDIWIDLSHYLSGRLNMMERNMWQGALLVFIVLSLFLRMKIAAWVIIGIPITFLGAFWLMPFWPVSMNTISLFGFIMVLGIVVDDAIIIGESIYTKIRADGHTLDNVIAGTHKVAIPATFGVLTTIAAFLPMLFIGPPAGVFFEAMGLVVVLCLLFSLVESKLILPAHLAAAKIDDVDEEDLFNPQREIGFWEKIPRFFSKINRHVQHALHRTVDNHYRPALGKAIDNRGVTVACFVAALILTFGIFGSGLARFVVFPDVPGDFVQTSLTMQDGTAPEVRNAAVEKVERALIDLNAEYVRDNPGAIPMISHLGVFSQGDVGAFMFLELPQDEDRKFEGADVTKLWRERVGEIPGVKELTFNSGGNFGGGAQLSFRLSGTNYLTLEAAAEELETKLAEYEGVFDIRNTASSGSDEIKLTIKPEAEALGITMSSLGRQVRQAFYGEEAQRIQRGKDEIKVMVRYPRNERRSVSDLENMRIRAPNGVEVPFSSVANISFGQGYSRISRLNRQRTVTVSADIDAEQYEPGEVIRSITSDFIPGLLAKHQGVSYGLEGSSEESAKLVRNMSIAGVASLFLIYALIAVPLRSYSQPLLIMSVIPFGIIGAVIGHVLLGKAISMFSIFGLIALSGVVVNDSLIMIDFVNKARAAGMPMRQAVIESGAGRFRAIILTSVTTAVGLIPIMLERSVQAQFVIPTAISMSFGIVFATGITLFLIPSLYMLQQDGFARFRQFKNWLLDRPNTTDATDVV